MEQLPPLPKFNEDMEIFQIIDFEIEYEGEMFMFSYEFKIGINFHPDDNEITVECVEEQKIPASWEP